MTRTAEPLIDPFTDLPVAPGPEVPEVEDPPGPPVHPLVADLRGALDAVAAAQRAGELAVGGLADAAELHRAVPKVRGAT